MRVHRDRLTSLPSLQFNELLANLLKDAHSEIMEDIAHEEEVQRQRHRNSVVRSSVASRTHRSRSSVTGRAKVVVATTRHISTWDSVLPSMETRIGRQLHKLLTARGVLAKEQRDETADEMDDVATMAASAMIASKVGLKLLERVRANKLAAGSEIVVGGSLEQRVQAVSNRKGPQVLNDWLVKWVPGFGTRSAPHSTFMF